MDNRQQAAAGPLGPPVGDPLGIGQHGPRGGDPQRPSELAQLAGEVRRLNAQVLNLRYMLSWLLTIVVLCAVLGGACRNFEAHAIRKAVERLGR